MTQFAIYSRTTINETKTKLFDCSLIPSTTVDYMSLPYAPAFVLPEEFRRLRDADIELAEVISIVVARTTVARLRPPKKLYLVMPTLPSMAWEGSMVGMRVELATR